MGAADWLDRAATHPRLAGSAVGLLVVAGLALYAAWFWHRASGLPWSARFIADDRGSGAAPRRKLTSTAFRVRGVPDGIVSVRSWRHGFRRVHVPLEVKPLHDTPRPSDLVQLAS